MQLHLKEIATKVAPGVHAIVLLDQSGWARRQSAHFPAKYLTDPAYHLTHPSSTAKKISGNSCAKTGCRTEYSNPSRISSITAAMPGTP
jgi:hypothetical protein